MSLSSTTGHHRYEKKHFQSNEELVEQGVQYLVSHIRSAMNHAKDEHSGQRVVIGLSGGSTPVPIYKALAQNYAHELDWSRIVLFLIDDRFVPSSHKDSNAGLVRSCFAPVLDKLADLVLPDTDTFHDWKECARDYSKRLEPLVGNVDIMVNGLGPDGHFASLFPPVADDAFGDADYTVATTTDRFAVHERISVNYAFLRSQTRAHTVFFITGQDKRAVWDEMESAAPATRDELSRELKRWPAIEFLYDANMSMYSA